MMQFCKSAFAILLLQFLGWTLNAQTAPGDVKIVGMMKDVMWKGQLQGKLDLDTITQKEHLYGLGPVAELTGELIIIDGRAYRSYVNPGGTINIEETFKVKAPFFSYAHIKKWTEIVVPDSIRNIQDLALFVDQLSKGEHQPFLFKMSGTVDSATLHVVNLPGGLKVKSPADVHANSNSYSVHQSDVDIVGFFSRKHQSIFTHHDTYLHMHLITADRRMMGHLDLLFFSPGKLKLYIPSN